MKEHDTVKSAVRKPVKQLVSTGASFPKANTSDFFSPTSNIYF